MDFKIVLQKNWRWRRDQMFTPGTYRVPEDMSEEMARRAVKEEGAVKVELPKPQPMPEPEPEPEPVDEPTDEPEAEDKPKRKRGRPPKTKMLGLAPENKSSLG